MRQALLAASVAVLMAGACGGGGGGGGEGGSPGGPGPTSTTAVDLTARVKAFTVSSRNHVPGRVEYPEEPPVGGDHAPIWQNCGFYSQPVPTERAVHSMEHGAVWITYRPELGDQEVRSLRALAASDPYVLVSPWTDGGLPAPVVASAWGLQLTAETAGDPALAAFVDRYAAGPQTPEPGAPCTGGTGSSG